MRYAIKWVALYYYSLMSHSRPTYFPLFCYVCSSAYNSVLTWTAVECVSGACDPGTVGGRRSAAGAQVTQ